MALHDLCEPLFQYICRLNRSARKGGNYEISQVQAEIKAILADARVKAGKAGAMAEWDKIEPPLVFFCDFMIRESALPWARDWKPLALEPGQTGGDQKFFALLDETLRDTSPQANDRLEVFYTCLGLGFTGQYTGQPDPLRRYMNEIAARLQAAGQFTDSQRICPDAYENIDSRDLVEPPGARLAGIAVALAGLIVVLFCVYGWLYHDTAQKLTTSLQTVKTRAISAYPPESAAKEAPK
jgi:type IV/VI secretion system ImpK/VasF family protein